ncbi:hypothetical protein LCGC14_3025390, partial [marine sediment metagenome]
STLRLKGKKLAIGMNECLECGVKHQLLKRSYHSYISSYKKDYCLSEGKDGGQLSSHERYDHDNQLAGKRHTRYKEFLGKGNSILDIGSGNGAFVDCMHNLGYVAHGLEICENYLGYTQPTYQGDFLEVDVPFNSYDTITMHDVLEHLVDPVSALKKCHRILKKDGILIIDFPDFFIKEGLHHWKPIEHLWMLRKDQLVTLFKSCGFKKIVIEKPIPSKLLLIARER